MSQDELLDEMLRIQSSTSWTPQPLSWDGIYDSQRDEYTVGVHIGLHQCWTRIPGVQWRSGVPSKATLAQLAMDNVFSRAGGQQWLRVERAAPASVRSAVCPCGIARVQCDYHR